MTRKTWTIAVMGATGAVGREILSILEDRKFPVGKLIPLASARSEGTPLEFDGEEIKVQKLTPDSFKGVDIVLSSPGSKVSAEFSPHAVKAGAVVVDNTSHFRMDPDVPLVVPEVNKHDIGMYKRRGIIANPNCSTIQMVVALKPLHDAARIKRVVVSTYQAVSGAGQKGIGELEQQVRDLFNARDVTMEVFPKRMAFNLIPCIPQKDAFLPDGSTTEEKKMVDETMKIMGDPSIKVHATCVRVPVFNGHSESVNVEFERPLSAEQARELLRKAPGVAVLDDPEKMLFPTPMDASGEDLVLVGRVREDPTVQHGLSMFVVGDNLRKGAALNAVQIAEVLISEYLEAPRATVQ
ncbi:MAG: aspartate-semialdehyde dehydrogenase [Myxococcota bacterium]